MLSYVLGRHYTTRYVKVKHLYILVLSIYWGIRLPKPRPFIFISAERIWVRVISPIDLFRAMRAMEICRTAELGGHVNQCDHCEASRISYNSRRNSHCPKCQSLEKERWLEARERDFLPTSYFNLVFTLGTEESEGRLQSSIQGCLRNAHRACGWFTARPN